MRHAKAQSEKQRAPPFQATRAAAAYFLGVISAGRYREISKPAATWHMVGLVQIFFIPFLLCTVAATAAAPRCLYRVSIVFTDSKSRRAKPL